MDKLRWLFPLFLGVLLLPGRTSAQERSRITGQVVAEGTNQPLPGVRVAIAALNMSTVSDQAGRFVLVNVPQGSHTLRATRIGYKPVARAVSVGAEAVTVTIEMAGDPLRLDELVVTGYGEQRRGDVAGAISSLRPDETVGEVPATDVNQLLQARLPGVLVVQNSGVPGSAITVRVRGSSSVSAGNEPLYVIDGVPVTQGDPSALNLGFGGQVTDAISDLSGMEIERIEVLKDASASAIYGSRASNGVVLITTKRGTAARTEFTVGGYYGTQKEWRRLDMLNAEQYLDIYNEGFNTRWGPAALCGCQPVGDPPYDDWFGYREPGRSYYQPGGPPGTDTDWLAQVLRRAPITSLEGSVRGGTDRARYYVSGSSVVQEGIIRSMGYRRLNGRLNLDYQPFERLTLGTNISLARRVTERAVADNSIYSPWSNGMAIPPIEPVFDSTGAYYETFYANPVAVDREREAFERGTRTLANAFAKYSLVEGVTARVSYGLDQLTTSSRAWDSPTWGFWEPSGGRAQAGAYFVTKVVYEGTVNFNRALRPGHEVSGVVGGSYEDNTDEWHYVQGLQLPTEYFKYISSAATIDDGTSERNDWGMLSYFGRLSYTFDDRITTTFNVRRDGSSRFGAAHRFGTFPSAAVLWRIGDEGFMQGQNVFSYLALRASYGVTGNQPLGNFAARGLFNGGSNYIDLPGISPSQLANPELRWEKTSQVNVGTDFSVLRDRLAVTVDYYDKRTDDLLVERPVPRTTGFATIWSNVGSMQNKGVELSATGRLFQSRDPAGLTWSATVNVSRNRNKVTALFENQPIGGGFASRVEVGEPLGFFYGYVTDGLFQSPAEICLTQGAETSAQRNARCAAAGLAFQNAETGPGDIRFRDLAGGGPNGDQPDGLISAADRRKIGSPWPDYEGGITNTVSFRGFDLSAFVQFSLGNDIFNANGLYMDQYGSFGDNHTTKALRRWTPTNTNTTEPRAIDGDPNGNARTSDRFTEDGSFWRLKNVVIGYTLPASLASRLGYRTARVYVQAQNLLTSTDYSGFDPEVNTAGQDALLRGTDFYTLPQTRTFTFGFNLGF
jgi:TonB-linked SusC/RagA family outer membrane protein